MLNKQCSSSLSDVAVCQSVILNTSMEKVKSMKSEDDTADCSDYTHSKITVVTSNEASKLRNQVLVDPDVQTPHEFAMIYTSLISPEADVEAVYLSPRSQAEGKGQW
jgi:hypothetical protein